jgi:hypothetical protein
LCAGHEPSPRQIRRERLRRGSRDGAGTRIFPSPIGRSRASPPDPSPRAPRPSRSSSQPPTRAFLPSPRGCHHLRSHHARSYGTHRHRPRTRPDAGAPRVVSPNRMYSRPSPTLTRAADQPDDTSYSLRHLRNIPSASSRPGPVYKAASAAAPPAIGPSQTASKRRSQPAAPRLSRENQQA